MLSPLPDPVERMSRGWRCQCGDFHEGIIGLNTQYPDSWVKPYQIQRLAALNMEEDFLSHDLCVIEGKYFFVRSLIEIPVVGSDQIFEICFWVAVRKADFERYFASYLNFTPAWSWAPEERWEATLDTRLPPLVLQSHTPCLIEPRTDENLPLIHLVDTSHPLVKAQNEGLTGQQLVEIYSANGHEPYWISQRRLHEQTLTGEAGGD